MKNTINAVNSPETHTVSDPGPPLPWWKRAKNRLVNVLQKHSLAPITNDQLQDRNYKLKSNQAVKMSDGTVYAKRESGQLIRLHPRKPYRNRKGQKRHIRLRRAERELKAVATIGEALIRRHASSTDSPTEVD